MKFEDDKLERTIVGKPNVTSPAFVFYLSNYFLVY